MHNKQMKYQYLQFNQTKYLIHSDFTYSWYAFSQTYASGDEHGITLQCPGGWIITQFIESSPFCGLHLAHWKNSGTSPLLVYTYFPSTSKSFIPVQNTPDIMHIFWWRKTHLYIWWRIRQLNVSWRIRQLNFGDVLDHLTFSDFQCVWYSESEF